MRCFELLLTVLSLQSTSDDTAPRAFRDPAPPRVHELAEVAPPEPRDFPALRFHAPPRPLAAGAVTQEWPGFLGPARDGRSRETSLALRWPEGGPPLVWEMERGQGYASPAVAEGRVVFTHRTADTAHIDCLAAETGKRYWRFSYSCAYRGRYISNGGPRSTPAISDGRVYVHGVAGMLHCLDLATGRVVWKRDLPEELGVEDGFFGVVASPLIVGDLLIQNVGAPGGPSVAAFDKHTGRIVWGTGNDWGPSCSSPVLATVHGRRRLFVMAGGQSRPPTGGLMVLDPLSGALDFTYRFRSRTYESVNGSSPIVDGDRVFLTSSYGLGSAVLELGADGGFDELWTNRHLEIQFSNPVFDQGRVYVIDGVSGRAGALVCVDPESGEELMRADLHWSETIERDGAETTASTSVGEGPLLWAAGHFLCLGDSGHLVSLVASAEGARVVSHVRLFDASESWTPLVISRGLLYVCQNNRDRSGQAPARLLCYDLRAEG